MKSRYEQLTNPQQRRQFAIFRSGAATVLAAALIAGAIGLPQGETPIAKAAEEFVDAVPPAYPPTARPVPVADGAEFDEPYPHQYAGQPGVF